MTVISFQDRVTTRRLVQTAARARLENIKADHALVAVMPPEPASHTYVQQRPTAFIAHLLATRDQAPQTRERRRADPSEAVSAYRETPKPMRPASGTQLSRQI